jgi:low temperature requirement protein LtrA
MKFLYFHLYLITTIFVIGGGSPFLTVDALEKMMEDPTVQQMVYP